MAAALAAGLDVRYRSPIASRPDGPTIVTPPIPLAGRLIDQPLPAIEYDPCIAVIAAIVDTACGYASYTLMPADVEVVTVEFKINFIAPAIGEKMVARGRVTKAGKTLTVCVGEAFAVKDGKEKLVATLQATMMTVKQKS